LTWGCPPCKYFLSGVELWGKEVIILEAKYENIIDIVETSSGANAAGYLKIGWILLTVVSVNSKDDNSSYILYSLGWSKESGDPKLPPKEVPKYGTII
jgi:hypothetical protein